MRKQMAVKIQRLKSASPPVKKKKERKKSRNYSTDVNNCLGWESGKGEAGF